MVKRSRSKNNQRKVSVIGAVRSPVRYETITPIERGRSTAEIHRSINQLLVSERAKKASAKSPIIVSRIKEPQLQKAQYVPTPSITTEPERRRDNGLRLPPAKKPVTQSLVPVRDKQGCKSRPTKNKGSGGSRAFIPWCKR